MSVKNSRWGTASNPLLSFYFRVLFLCDSSFPAWINNVDVSHTLQRYNDVLQYVYEYGPNDDSWSLGNIPINISLTNIFGQTTWVNQTTVPNDLQCMNSSQHRCGDGIIDCAGGPIVNVADYGSLVDQPNAHGLPIIVEYQFDFPINIVRYRLFAVGSSYLWRSWDFQGENITTGQWEIVQSVVSSTIVPEHWLQYSFINPNSYALYRFYVYQIDVVSANNETEIVSNETRSFIYNSTLTIKQVQLFACPTGLLEECDTADSNLDNCTNYCMLPKCGDGLVNGNETCDPSAPPYVTQGGCDIRCSPMHTLEVVNSLVSDTVVNAILITLAVSVAIILVIFGLALYHTFKHKRKERQQKREQASNMNKETSIYSLPAIESVT